MNICLNCLQVENDLEELRGDLQTWLTAQADKTPESAVRDNPFAYASGITQTRFGDDFDHERMARYDVSLFGTPAAIQARVQASCCLVSN